MNVELTTHNPQAAQTSAAGQSFTFDADCNDAPDHFAGKPTGGRRTLPDDLKALTTFELRAGVTAEDVKVVVESNLNCLSDKRYHWTREDQTRQTRYKVERDGKPLGVYVVAWDANGKVSHKPMSSADDPDLCLEWDHYAWDMIWVSVLRHFGQLAGNTTPAAEPGGGPQKSKIRINHTTGPIQPGDYAPDDARTIQAAQIALDTLKATIPGLLAQPPQMNAGAIVIKQGKPGRKPDALYMRAFEMIAEGTPKNEARAWFYKEAGIITPDEKSNNAFDQAMRRHKKRMTK